MKLKLVNMAVVFGIIIQLMLSLNTVANNSTEETLFMDTTENEIGKYVIEEKDFTPNEYNNAFYNVEKLYKKYPDLRNIEISEDNPNYSSKDGILYSKNGEILLYCPPNYNKPVYIGATVKKINYNAFLHCKLLESVSVDIENPTYSSDNGVLMNKEKTWIIYYPCKKSGVCIIEGSILGIAPIAFENASICELVFMQRRDTINISSFTFDCASLKEIVYVDNSDKKIKPMWYEEDKNGIYDGARSDYIISHVQNYALPTNEINTANKKGDNILLFNNWLYVPFGLFIIIIMGFIFIKW